MNGAGFSPFTCAPVCSVLSQAGKGQGLGCWDLVSLGCELWDTFSWNLVPSELCEEWRERGHFWPGAAFLRQNRTGSNCQLSAVSHRAGGSGIPEGAVCPPQKLRLCHPAGQRGLCSCVRGPTAPAGQRPTLLALRPGEGARSQGVLEAGKGQGMDFVLEPRKEPATLDC